MTEKDHQLPSQSKIDTSRQNSKERNGMATEANSTTRQSLASFAATIKLKSSSGNQSLYKKMLDSVKRK